MVMAITAGKSKTSNAYELFILVLTVLSLAIMVGLAGGTLVKTTGTGCSRRSTARRARSGARWHCGTGSEAWASRSARACTPARSSSAARTSAAWLSISPRAQALGEPGEVLVTRTVKDLVVGSELRFADRGAHELRGVPDTWELFGVRS